MKHPFPYLVLLITLVIAGASAKAAPGDVDPSFLSDTRGYVTSSINCFAVTPGGKHLLGFSAQSSIPPRVNFQPVGSLVRLEADGRIDTAYRGYTESATVTALSISVGGSIVAGGSFRLPDGTWAAVMRFSADGLVDPSFQIIKGLGSVTAICEQSDGKLLVGGNFSIAGQDPHRTLLRLNADGSLDESFQAGAGFNGDVSVVRVQADGKIFVGGAFTTFAGAAAPHVIRLNTDGSRDLSFQTGNIFSSSAAAVTGLELGLEGRVSVSGSNFQVGWPFLASLIRLLPDGSLDSGFQPADEFSSVASDEAGRLIAGADLGSDPLDVAIMRYLSDGSRDPQFTPAPVPYPPPHQIVVSNGTIYFSGAPSLGALDSAGNRTAFFLPTGPTDQVEEIVPLPNGNLLIRGDFPRFAGAFVHGVAEVSPAGALVKAFPGLAPLYQSGPDGVAVQQDGKVLFLITNIVRRCNPDGSLDSSFAFSGPRVGRTMAAQADGRVLVGFAGSPSENGLVRLLPDGNTDTTFSPSAAQRGGSVEVVKIQADGKILIAGSAFEMNGTTRRRLIRLNADGSLDSGFLCGYPALQNIRDIQLMDDGRIVVAGKLDDGAFPIHAASRVARLLPNGSVDPSFVPCLPSTTEVYKLALQADGKIVIAGNFRSINGVDRSGVARLDPDGSFDSTFDPGTGIEGVLSSGGDVRAFALALDGSGKILLGGSFLAFNGEPHAFLVRLESEGFHHAPVHQFTASILADEDSAPHQFSVSTIDPDGSPLVWSSIGTLGNIAVIGIAPDQQAVFSPKPDKNGSEYTVVISRDPEGHADATLIPTVVNPINDPPIVTERPAFLIGPVATVGTLISLGTWNDAVDTNAPLFPSPAFRWEIADSADGAGATILPGADTPQIAPDLALVGKYLRVVLTVSDSGVGSPSSLSTSAATDWELILEPLSYDSWKLQHFGSESDPAKMEPGADPDGDGAANLKEYTLSMDPKLRDAQYLPQLSTEDRDDGTGAERYLVLTYRIAPNAVDSRIIAQSCDILPYWQSEQSWWPLFSRRRIKNSDGSETITLRDLRPISQSPSRFLRLSITMP